MTTTPGKHAVLPLSLEKPSIGSMVVGRVGFVIPQAMWIDPKRRCWLFGHFAVYDTSAGIVNMRIEVRKDGYHVWLPLGAKWIRSDKLESNNQAKAEIPVVELHT